MSEDTDMRVTKRDGELEDIAFDKIITRVKKLGQEANIQINYSSLVMKVIDQLYDKIPTTKIDELTEKLNESYKDNEILLSKINGIESKTLLEEKTQGMPISKKEFVYKLLNDKESSYIQENFNYVVEMFERSEEETASKLVVEAKQKAQTLNANVPSAKRLVNESNTDNRPKGFVNEYLNELNRK